MKENYESQQAAAIYSNIYNRKCEALEKVPKQFKFKFIFK